MKTINATNFYSHWRDFFDTRTDRSEWAKQWKNSGTWTKYALGEASANEMDCAFGQYMKVEYKKLDKELRFRTEDGKVDMTMSLHKNFEAIPTLGKDYTPENFEILHKDKSVVYYPTIYDVLLEHENEIYYSWNEIAKLAWFRSPLKVLITYHTDNIDNEKAKKERQMLIKQYEMIVGKSSENFADHHETEYLLILGRKHDDQLIWTADVFDHSGKFMFAIN